MSKNTGQYPTTTEMLDYTKRKLIIQTMESVIDQIEEQLKLIDKKDQN